MGRESIDDLLRLLRGYVHIENTRGMSYGCVRSVIYVGCEIEMTQGRMDVKEQRIFSPDKIFTTSKASRWNL